jgi:hypothetical protein
VNGLQQDLEQSARGLASGQQRTARQLNEAAGTLSRDRVADRIREGKQALERNELETARANERAIERSLNGLSERLQSAEQSARKEGAGGAEEALDRTRQLADNLDSLRRRLDENNARSNASQDGRRDNQQQGQQPGNSRGDRGQRQDGQQQNSQGQQQRGQQSEGSQSGQPQGGSRRATGSSDGRYTDDDRQVESELRERLREAEGLRREWGVTGEPTRTLSEVIEELRRFADGRMEGNAQTAAALKADVVEPLRQLELELSRQLQRQGSRTTLRLRDE